MVGPAAPAAPSLMVVLVHGWSVHHTNTYGELPARLKAEAAAQGLTVDVQNVWLGKYISFSDEVRLDDISRAFQAAVERDLRPRLQGRRFACITHSTGGPVVRNWWNRYYLAAGKPDACPMSHLVMLAPANFGAALAALAKGKLSRIKSWFDGVEPGTGVLDWLALGSPDAWALNEAWCRQGDVTAGANPVYPFVLTGQWIDRRLYDHVNSYTGEVGSDGVVRAAAANLNTTYLRLEQPAADVKDGALVPTQTIRAQRTAFRIVESRSHSGEAIGILRSIRNDGLAHPTMSQIWRCLLVRSSADYTTLCDAFVNETARLVEAERIERAPQFLRKDHVEIHDQQSMLIFRLRDDQGLPIVDFDFLLTGTEDDPNRLPKGFLTDRQQNQRARNTVSYFMNHDLLMGTPELRLDPADASTVIRASVDGVGALGIRIEPHQVSKALFVRYVSARISATPDTLKLVLKPNETTMVDVVLRRVVGDGTFQLTTDTTPAEFRNQPPGDPVP